MASIEDLENRIKIVEERNKKVEANKAWEISWTRRILLIIFTYLAIGLYMNSIKVANPWINAVVPAVGFLLSTLTIPFFKKLWLKYRK